jgi:hypothetical protein
MDLELTLLNKIAKLEKSVAKQKNYAMRLIDQAILSRLKAELAALAV